VSHEQRLPVKSKHLKHTDTRDLIPTAKINYSCGLTFKTNNSQVSFISIFRDKAIVHLNYLGLSVINLNDFVKDFRRRAIGRTLLPTNR
jgi:hypothetical protein